MPNIFRKKLPNITTMQNFKSISILFLLLIIAFPAYSQYARRYGSYNSRGDNYHFGYISGGVGYTSLQSQVPDLVPKGYVGGLVGLGYEFRNRGLWLSVGAQFSLHNSKAEMDGFRFDQSGYDTQGKEVTLHYSIDEKDQQNWAFIDIPILIGYYFHGFHIGAGPKIGYAVSSKVKSEGTYTLSATNELYGIEFSDMPQHGYTTYDFKNTSNANLYPLVSIVGEVGYDVLSSVETRSLICNILKVSFYFEYGLNNLVKPVSTNRRVEINPNDATDIKVNPYLAAGMTQSHRVVPFFTGLKITYLIGGSRSARAGGYHKGCHCYNN